MKTPGNWLSVEECSERMIQQELKKSTFVQLHGRATAKRLAAEQAWEHRCSNLNPGFGHGEPNPTAVKYWEDVHAILAGGKPHGTPTETR